MRHAFSLSRPPRAVPNRSSKPWARIAAFCAFHLGCSLAMVFLLALPARGDAAVAAVFPPWYSQGRILHAIVAADGRLVRFGNRQWIVVVAPSTDLAPFQTQLADAGVLAFINPRIVGGCGENPPGQIRTR